MRRETIVIFNYFEGIAIAEQGFYVESIVREHLEPMMRSHVKEFLDPALASKMELDTSDFERLRDLLERWSSRPIQQAV